MTSKFDAKCVFKMLAFITNFDKIRFEKNISAFLDKKLTLCDLYDLKKKMRLSIVF